MGGVLPRPSPALRLGPMPVERGGDAAVPAGIRALRQRLGGLETEAGRLAGLALAPRSDDVFIATSPKCGTTWVQQIVHSLRKRGDLDFDEISCVVPCLEFSETLGIPLDVDQVARPRAFKTHCWYEHCPKGGRYIVVARDPTDVAVSFYKFFEVRTCGTRRAGRRPDSSETEGVVLRARRGGPRRLRPPLFPRPRAPDEPHGERLVLGLLPEVGRTAERRAARGPAPGLTRATAAGGTTGDGTPRSGCFSRTSRRTSPAPCGGSRTSSGSGTTRPPSRPPLSRRRSRR